ncbi:MAG: hypothetical protein JRJ78_12365 [Deltaproteobacteria bacterium]|nr:hypothetical protein [Deltaproteobacteria bacterium]
MLNDLLYPSLQARLPGKNSESLPWIGVLGKNMIICSMKRNPELFSISCYVKALTMPATGINPEALKRTPSFGARHNLFFAEEGKLQYKYQPFYFPENQHD